MQGFSLQKTGLYHSPQSIGGHSRAHVINTHYKNVRLLIYRIIYRICLFTGKGFVIG